jgi:hypothetical protein
VAKQGPVRRIVVDRVQPARDTTIAGMPHDDRRFAEPVKNAGGREQLQLDLVGVCSRRDQSVHDVLPRAQMNCAFCIRLRWSVVVCNFYDSLGFAARVASQHKAPHEPRHAPSGRWRKGLRR